MFEVLVLFLGLWTTLPHTWVDQFRDPSPDLSRYDTGALFCVPYDTIQVCQACLTRKDRSNDLGIVYYHCDSHECWVPENYETLCDGLAVVARNPCNPEDCLTWYDLWYGMWEASLSLDRP